MSALKPEYGPTLYELVARLPRRARVAVTVAGVLGLALAIAVAVRAGADETAVIVRKPVAFNLAYGPDLERRSQPGALLALERRRGDLFLDSYVVRELVLAPYRGSATGTLPVVAFDYIQRLRRRYEGFELVLEGRTRVNNAVGYQVVFRARLGERTLYGRHLMLVPEEPAGLRRGIVLELASTPAAGTPNAEAAGTTGALKSALRSLRFGTEREGGTA